MLRARNEFKAAAIRRRLRRHGRVALEERVPPCRSRLQDFENSEREIGVIAD